MYGEDKKKKKEGMKEECSTQWDMDRKFRTDYADTMQPKRGARTYPSVNIVEGDSR